MQEQGRGDRFKDHAFETLVEEAIQHWTKMWMADAEYDTVIASNVKVGYEPLLQFVCIPDL
jgi:hypothetical protein